MPDCNFKIIKLKKEKQHMKPFWKRIQQGKFIF